MKIRNTSKRPIEILGNKIPVGGSTEIDRSKIEGAARRAFDGMVDCGDIGLGDAPAADSDSGDAQVELDKAISEASEAKAAAEKATAEAVEAKAAAEKAQAEAQKIIDGANEKPKSAKK